MPTRTELKAACSHLQSMGTATRRVVSIGVFCLAVCAGAFGADAFLTAPNDTCAGVIPVLLNVPASGTLDSTTNNDYQLSGSACFTGIGQSASTAAGRDVVYSFTAPAAGNYSFHVLSTGGFGNAVLYLASTCPTGIPPVTVSTCVAAANRSFFSVGADEVLCQPLAANQLVYVFVDDTSASSTSNYRLEVTPCTQETEPNDGTASANGLACPMEGSINPGSDVDFFAFPTTSVDQRVFALADGFAANSTDFDMRVTTTTDTLEFDDQNADGYFGSTSPAIAGTKTTGPNTYIRLNQHVGNASEPYRLYTLLEPPSSQATTETDPGGTGNNSIATANAIGKLYIYGTISTADDDYFSVCAEKGDVIFAAMDCDPGYDNTYINGWLTLFDAAGATLVNVDDTQATTTSRTPSAGTLTATTPSPPAEALAYQVAATGLYYLRVRSNTTAPSADYLLGVGLNCQPAQADLAVSQTALPNPVRAGNQLTSTITLDNNGGTTAQNVSFNIFTSTFEYFVSLSITGPSGWSCTTPAVGTSGTITCSNPCLPRSASAGPTVFTLVTRVDCQIPSGIVHAAGGSSITPDPNTANNNNNLSISVQSCNDGNACTDDVCSPANGCQFLANANACNDLNPCTTSDVCSNGTCAGTPVPPPAELDNSLTLTKNAFGWATLSWTDLTGPMFNIYRGLDGPAGWAYNQACWVGGIAGPPATDTALPPAASSYYYLVSRKNTCGESVIGRASNGTPAPNSSPCP